MPPVEAAAVVRGASDGRPHTGGAGFGIAPAHHGDLRVRPARRSGDLRFDQPPRPRTSHPSAAIVAPMRIGLRLTRARHKFLAVWDLTMERFFGINRSADDRKAAKPHPIAEPRQVSNALGGVRISRPDSRPSSSTQRKSAAARAGSGASQGLVQQGTESEPGKTRDAARSCFDDQSLPRPWTNAEARRSGTANHPQRCA